MIFNRVLTLIVSSTLVSLRKRHFIVRIQPLFLMTQAFNSLRTEYCFIIFVICYFFFQNQLLRKLLLLGKPSKCQHRGMCEIL